MANQTLKPEVNEALPKIPVPSFAYKPHFIGPVIKTILKEKRMAPKDLAAHLGISKRNIHRIFTVKYLSMPLMFKVCEALQENLLLQYQFYHHR